MEIINVRWYRCTIYCEQMAIWYETFGPKFTLQNINLKIKSFKPFCIGYFSYFTGTMTFSFGI